MPNFGETLLLLGKEEICKRSRALFFISANVVEFFSFFLNVFALKCSLSRARPGILFFVVNAMSDSRPFDPSPTRGSFAGGREALSRMNEQAIGRLQRELGDVMGVCDEEAGRDGEGPRIQSTALAFADQALAANVAGCLSGPLLQKIWGYALSDKPGADVLAARMLENPSQWLFASSSLGEPAVFALGVGIALQDESARLNLNEKIVRFAALGVCVQAAMDWLRESEEWGPRIMGAPKILAALEACALSRAAFGANSPVASSRSLHRL